MPEAPVGDASVESQQFGAVPPAQPVGGGNVPWAQGRAGTGLLVVVLGLIVAGLVLLVIGFDRNSLTPLYASIVCAAAAGVVLIVYSQWNRRRARQGTSGPTPAPGQTGLVQTAAASGGGPELGSGDPADAAPDLDDGEQ
jgi:ABC-type branched-subunit amino acid transport system permease subunit